MIKLFLIAMKFLSKYKAPSELEFTNEFADSYVEEDSLLLTWKKQEEETDLFFSGDGGLTWDTIAVNMSPDIKQLWYHFPLGEKDSCLFRIHLSSAPEIQDISPYFSIEERILPAAKIFRPSSDLIVSQGYSVYFQGEEAAGADSYHWDFGNGSTFSQLEPGSISLLY